MRRIREKVADIAILLMFLTYALKKDLKKAIKDKPEINRDKYPADKIRGIARKTN